MSKRANFLSMLFGMLFEHQEGDSTITELDLPRAERQVKKWTGPAPKKPGRGHLAIGYDEENHCWLKKQYTSKRRFRRIFGYTAPANFVQTVYLPRDL